MPYDKIIGLVEHTSRMVEGSAGVNDFYVLLGRPARLFRGRHQEGLPEARDGIPSRPELVRRTRRPGSRRSPRRTRCFGIPRSARPTIATARRGSARARAASGSTTWTCPRRSTSSCATSAGWAASSPSSAAAVAGRTRAAGQDVRVTVQAHPRRGGHRRQEVGQAQDAWSAARRATGSGAKPGTKPARCTTCGGSGEVRRAARSMFGQFVSVSACPDLRGRGPGDPRAVRGLPRRGPGAGRPHRDGGDPGRASPATTT